MSLRLRRGGGIVAPPTQSFGPTLGAQSVRDAAGPRGSIGVPSGSKTILNPASTVAANQAAINADATGLLWWPKGTYAMTTIGYSIPANKVNWLETGPLRTATDTALLTMTSTTANVITVTGANVQWHGGIIDGGGHGLRQSSGGIADNFVCEDAEIKNSFEACFHLSGGFPAAPATNTQNMTVRYCLFHHAGRYNAHTLGAEGWLWEHNETHHGNERHIPTTRASSFPDDEGDCKFLNVTGFVYRYNWSHDNDGDLWLDTNVTDGLIEESVFENNYRMGIFNEDNDGVVIRRNYFENNGRNGGWGTPTPVYWQSGAYMGHVQVARAADTEITLNDFVTTGVVTSSVPHFDVRLHYQNIGAVDTINTNVHHNRFQRTKASAALSGFVTTYLTADAQVAHQVNDNVYDFNEYHVPVGQGGVSWFSLPTGAGGDRTFTQWQAGASLPFAPGSYYDPHGTLTADL